MDTISQLRPSLRFTRHLGPEITSLIEPLASLRIAVFSDFPYLYKGTMAYERDYLKRYARIAESFVLAVWEGEQLVGATTATPLRYEMEAIRQPLQQMPWALDRLFYFGESLLLAPYRGQGIGHRFFDAREQHAKDLAYQGAIFCSVIRPATHPLRPTNYRSHHQFWEKRGYTPQACYCHLPWLDRNEAEETTKALQFWHRNWAPQLSSEARMD